MNDDHLDIRRFDFDLPRDLIAQEPAARRDRSRLLVVDRAGGGIRHHHFHEIGDLLPAGGRLYRNNASVLPARLHGFRPTGGAVECLLLSPGAEPNQWRCFLKPAKKLPPGTGFGLDGEYRAEVVRVLENGERLVAFSPQRDEPVTTLAERIGKVPLPPYIQRDKNDPRQALDRERYETVYADKSRPVAAAAPTAGLHFTPELIGALENAGFSFHEVTLHVGAGTFQPIQTERISDHRIHHEIYEIPAQTRAGLTAAQAGPRIAVGTTSVRALEDYARKCDHAETDNRTRPFLAEADLFLYPPATFAVTDALITNFHLPRSSLLCLVAAFLAPGRLDGIEWLREIYAEAVAEKYRFYSYGDAMLIL